MSDSFLLPPHDMYLGYNTNGFAHHAIEDTLNILADIGYQGVALTIDHRVLNPLDADFDRQVDLIRQQIQRLGLRTVIETGARYLLDPRRKHFPTLMSLDPSARQRRSAFLKQAIDLAYALSSDCVSLWSGTIDDPITDETAWERLTGALQPVIKYARTRGVMLGFEPEPGMWIDTQLKYDELSRRMQASDVLGLTLDIGHLQCNQELPLADNIRQYAPQIVNIHIEDMRCGEHEHRMFGEGEINFAAVFEALRDSRYQGGVFVELSRHSHAAPDVAQRSFDFLSSYVTAE